MTMWSGPSNNILCLESSQLQQLLTCQLLVQSTICVQPFVTPWTAAHQASLSLNVYWSFPEFMFIASVMPSKHLILCCPLLLLPSIFPSIRVFSYDTCKCMFIASIHVNACSFPESFPMLFASAGQNIGALASASVLSMHIQDWFLLGLTDLIHIFRLLTTFKQGILIFALGPPNYVSCPDSKEPRSAYHREWF